MEGITASGYKSARGYWKRRGYQKLNAKSRRRTPTVELGVEGGPRRRRFWRIRLTPRLKFKLRFSPKKFILGLRDAYVNMMTKLSTTRFINSGFAGYAGEGINGFGVRPLKEYDEKMIIQIYKSLVVAQSQLVPPRIDPPLATIAEC